MKFLIAGLGNPGEDYQFTRHNIGFLLTDTFAKKYDLSFEVKRYSFFAEKRIRGRQFYFIKPTTYINLSGKAVNYWLKKLEISSENLMVMLDDIALPAGKIRIRAKGGDGGHNGLTSIIYELASDNFPRLRFGIGDNYAKGRQVDYVLGEWSEEEKQLLQEKMDTAIEAVECFAFEGIGRAMTRFNK